MEAEKKKLQINHTKSNISNFNMAEVQSAASSKKFLAKHRVNSAPVRNFIEHARTRNGPNI